MSLKRKASARKMLTRFSSFIAVALLGPAILADASRTGHRTGLPALVGLILGGALTRPLLAVASRPNDTPKHTQVLPDALTRLDEHYGWVTSRWGDINFKDESRFRRRCHQATEDLAGRACAALTLADTDPLSMRPAPMRAFTSRRVTQLGWAG